MTKDLQKGMAWRFALFVLLLSVAGAANANPIDRRYARIVATHFLDLNGGRSNDLTDISEAAGFEHLYVFATDSSFVIVADDNRVQPILGYSFSGQFATENMPDNIRGWLQGYSDMVQTAIENQQRATAEITRQWTDLYEGNHNTDRAVSVVAPLVQTQWNQGSPYNLLCPSNSVTGCVATAMAQVMKYWNYPANGIGTHTYTPSTHPEYRELTVDFGSIYYNWTNMTNTYSSSSTNAQKQAVATLMYSCGVSVNMDYTPNSSGTSSQYVASALKAYFNYSSDVQFQSRTNYTDDVWISMLKADLDQSRPIYYSGSGSGGGHAFVCDGYSSNNYFHFNWGWGGYCDAYYSIDNMNPGPGGIGSGSNGVYNDGQAAVFGIHPAECTASAPRNLTYTLNNDIVTLNWQAASGAAGYTIYRDDDNRGSCTNNYNVTPANYGIHTYYIRSYDNNFRESPSSNTITVDVNNYPTPVVHNLAATVSGNDVSLNWNAPSWCYPEAPTATLSYGNGETYSSWSSTCYGHRYPASMMAQYTNKAVYKIRTYVQYPGTYTVYIYTNSSSGKPSASSLAATKYVNYHGTLGWIDFDFFYDPIIISGDTDLWVVMKQESTGESFPVPSYNLSSYNSDACYVGSTPTNINSLPSSYSVSWFIQTYITDGIYTYNIYRDGSSIANNVNATTYADNNLTAGAYNYYVKTNYYAGESATSNQVSAQIGEVSYYYITATANPTTGGSVTGGGSYLLGSTCTLTATANSGYSFSQWNDGSTANPRTFTVTENATYTACFTEQFPTGAINGLFSVSETQQVYFSQGNLQYKASTAQWRFATNQYDYIGNANSNISSSYSGYIDLFGWGTSGWDCGNTYYRPWDYEGNSDAGGRLYGPPGRQDLTGDYVNSDWGYYNAISNGGNASHIWRTLKQSEWDYVFNTRSTTSGIRYAKAQVASVNGIILLPDDWSEGYYSLININNGSADYNSNVISSSSWTNSLQAHGAVFLPAAGDRYGTSVGSVGSVGYYWSASNDGSYNGCAMVLLSDYFSTAGSSFLRCQGLSVRLVQPLQNTSMYNIDATSSPTTGGTITGIGTYLEGQSCTVVATANANYTFTNWTENGNVVSTDASYTFIVTGNRTLTANFTAISTGIPAGAINGLFSVSANQQVWFSQGNLQYIGSAAIPYWKFAENQWDYLGTSQNGTNQAIDRDLFGWGTSGYNHGAVCYVPWSTNGSYSNYYAYGSDTYNLNDQTGMADWGYNAISNGGNLTNMWRTLTTEEWTYLFRTRATASGIRYASACVNGINGIIVLPDNWDPSYFELNGTNGSSSSGASYNSNIISASQWSILEQHGAVFLPAAGRRSVATVNSVGSTGYYWSSSYSTSTGAYNASPNSGGIIPNNSSSRSMGYSVRLVQSSQSYSYNIEATPNPTIGGNVTGGGTYLQGSTCTLTATPNPGYSFTSWMENNAIVSTELTYSFEVTSSRNLVANFEEMTNHWTPENPDAYSLSMALTGIIQIDGIEQFSNQLEIGAFCNGECRGASMATYFFPTQRYVVQLLIFGESGDQLTFKLYDHALGQELDLTSPEAVTFVANGYGSLENPYILNFTGSVTQTYTLPIAGYDNPAGNYYLIAPPIDDVNPAEIVGMTVGDYDLYYFDQGEELEWRNYKTDHFNLESGKGYLYAHKTDVTLTFTGMPYNGDGKVTLRKIEGASFEGWNLIGNPFPQVATLDRDCYIMNTEGSEIVASTTRKVNPMQGIFVIANSDNEEMTFVPQNSTDESSKIVINVSKNRAEIFDRIIVRFEGNSRLPKLMLNPDNTKLYVSQDSIDYAVVSVEGNNTTPICFKAKENGTYTLTVDITNLDLDYLHLFDNKTGTDVDFLQVPSYTFDARTTDYAERFNLIYWHQ